MIKMARITISVDMSSATIISEKKNEKKQKNYIRIQALNKKLTKENILKSNLSQESQWQTQQKEKLQSNQTDKFIQVQQCNLIQQNLKLMPQYRQQRQQHNNNFICQLYNYVSGLKNHFNPHFDKCAKKVQKIIYIQMIQKDCQISALLSQKRIAVFTLFNDDQLTPLKFNLDLRQVVDNLYSLQLDRRVKLCMNRNNNCHLKWQKLASQCIIKLNENKAKQSKIQSFNVIKEFFTSMVIQMGSCPLKVESQQSSCTLQMYLVYQDHLSRQFTLSEQIKWRMEDSHYLADYYHQVQNEDLNQFQIQQQKKTLLLARKRCKLITQSFVGKWIIKKMSCFKNYYIQSLLDKLTCECCYKW